MSNRGFKWDFQLKCTTEWAIEGEELVYDLEAKTYNGLAARAATAGATAAFLIVLCLPQNTDEWMSLNEDQLILRKCGYWYRVSGAPSTNTTSLRIRIPRRQVLNPSALTQLFATLRQEVLQ